MFARRPIALPTLASEGGFDKMPSLVRFLVVVGTLSAVVSGGLYLLATKFEPAQHEVTKPIPNVKIRRP